MIRHIRHGHQHVQRHHNSQGHRNNSNPALESAAANAMETYVTSGGSRSAAGDAWTKISTMFANDASNCSGSLSDAYRQASVITAESALDTSANRNGSGALKAADAMDILANAYSVSGNSAASKAFLDAANSFRNAGNHVMAGTSGTDDSINSFRSFASAERLTGHSLLAIALDDVAGGSSL